MGNCNKEEHKKFKVVEIKKMNNSYNFNNSQISNLINITNNTNIIPNLYMNNNQMQQNNFNYNYNKNKNINSYLFLSYDFLKYGCNIPENMFDSQGDCLSGWGSGKSGPPNYLKDYFPPLNWTGVGLKVLNIYDNGDNNWIKRTNKNNGEWYIGYHGTKTIESVRGILFNGFRKGPNQGCINYNNINPLNNYIDPLCGDGVYFTPNIDEAKKHTLNIPYNGYNYKVVFMCSINPFKVKIADVGNGKEYWIVNGDNLNDIYGRKKDDEVRPYRILLKIEKYENLY